MKKSLTKIALAFVITVIPLFANSAKACSCLPLPSPYKSYQEARAVFVGKVTGYKDVSVSEQGRKGSYTATERHYSFAVEESFKGAKTSEMDINAGRTDTSCYSGFTEGDTYLVYAYGESETALYSGMCTRTNNRAWALDDIHYLRALLKGVREPRVYGSVTRTENDLSKSTSAVVVPLEGIKVVVEGEGRRFEGVTDKQGLFSIDNVPDGAYKARPELPDKYMSYWPDEKEFVLGPNEEGYPLAQQGDAAYARFRVGWNNTISGRILDAEGNLITRAKPALLSPRPNDEPLVIEEESYDHREKGEYGFSGLTPGRYLLSVKIRAPFKSRGMRTGFYYPSAVTANQADEIVISESLSLTDIDIKLPAGYLVRQIEGVVVWPDGSPVGDAWVFLADSKSSEDDDKKYDWASSDKEGRFSLQSFVGAEYWVYASARTLGMKTRSGKDLEDIGVQQLKAQPVKVSVGKTNKPLRIVIPLPEGVKKPEKKKAL
jgi:hypothetical protein